MLDLARRDTGVVAEKGTKAVDEPTLRGDWPSDEVFGFVCAAALSQSRYAIGWIRFDFASFASKKRSTV
jgi:hypothetical protein